MNGQMDSPPIGQGVYTTLCDRGSMGESRMGGYGILSLSTYDTRRVFPPLTFIPRTISYGES